MVITVFVMLVVLTDQLLLTRSGFHPSQLVQFGFCPSTMVMVLR